MRGGRNKFGPMYKRDRARKLQIMRQRQLAIQALRGSIGGGVGIGQLGSDGASAQLQGIDYHQPYSNMHIKQEIQIPQVCCRWWACWVLDLSREVRLAASNRSKLIAVSCFLRSYVLIDVSYFSSYFSSPPTPFGVWQFRNVSTARVGVYFSFLEQYRCLR